MKTLNHSSLDNTKRLSTVMYSTHALVHPKICIFMRLCMIIWIDILSVLLLLSLLATQAKINISIYVQRSAEWETGCNLSWEEQGRQPTKESSSSRSSAHGGKTTQVHGLSDNL